MSEELTNRIITIALGSGADLVGIVSADQLNRAPEGHRPSDLLPTARSVVVLACGRKLNEDRYYIGKFVSTKFGVRLKRILAHRGMNKVARFLKLKGFDVAIERSGWSDMLSFRRATYYSGLGVMGKGGFVIHPKYGPLNVLCCIVTNAPLNPGRPLNVDLCKVCTLCLKVCAYGAITPCGFDGCKCRFYDYYDAKKGISKYGPCNAKCVNLCPIGKFCQHARARKGLLGWVKERLRKLGYS